MITVSDPSSISKWRWVICCPGILESKKIEVNAWLDVQGITYVNIGARYWIESKVAKNWFLLRWA